MCDRRASRSDLTHCTKIEVTLLTFSRPKYDFKVILMPYVRIKHSCSCITEFITLFPKNNTMLDRASRFISCPNSFT